MNNETLSEPKIKEQFITGSSLVRGVTPKDKDVVCLFDDWNAVEAFVKTKNINHNEPVSLNSQMRFFSCYSDDGKTNYICTDDVELFYRFKAYSGALSLLQIKERSDRVDLATACLYWVG